MAANLDANVINALRFLDDVKQRFVHAEVPQLNVYAQFIDSMSEYKSGQLDRDALSQRVRLLFAGHPDLVQEFELFEANMPAVQ